ncbi:glycosyltransferase [Novosphingobium resinovorum]
MPLVVVGAQRGALVAAGLAVPDDAVFVGSCDDQALRALYAGARCLLCPSRTEGFGLPPLEAMLCGTPAVVAPAGAVPEVCRDAVLYADVDDPASWAQAIAALDPASLRARSMWDISGRASSLGPAPGPNCSTSSSLSATVHGEKRHEVAASPRLRDPAVLQW